MLKLSKKKKKKKKNLCEIELSFKKNYWKTIFKNKPCFFILTKNSFILTLFF